jgi:hypothetical protein
MIFTLLHIITADSFANGVWSEERGRVMRRIVALKLALLAGAGMSAAARAEIAGKEARTYFSGELPDRCDGASKSRLHHVVRMKVDGTIAY